MRTIIYFGSENVGTTTISTSTALEIGKSNLKTLLISTDNNIINILNNNSPFNNIDIHIINHYELNIEYWKVIYNWFRRLLNWQRLNNISMTEIPIYPGINQLISLLEMTRLVSNNNYDVVIINLEIMDELLRLLSYPELVEYWLNKLYKSNSYVFKIVRPFAKVLSGGFEIPNETVISNGETLIREIRKCQDIILSAETTFRIVMNPNLNDLNRVRKMTTYLSLLGFKVDNIIVNKLLPVEVKEGYLSEWYNDQKKILNEIKSSFNPIPIIELKLLNRIIDNIDSFKYINDIIYKSIKPNDILYNEPFIKITGDDYYKLEVILDLKNINTIEYYINDSELQIKYDDSIQTFYLPQVLQGKIIKEYVYENKRLSIYFIKK